MTESTHFIDSRYYCFKNTTKICCPVANKPLPSPEEVLSQAFTIDLEKQYIADDLTVNDHFTIHDISVAASSMAAKGQGFKELPTLLNNLCTLMDLNYFIVTPVEYGADTVRVISVPANSKELKKETVYKFDENRQLVKVSKGKEMTVSFIYKQGELAFEPPKIILTHELYNVFYIDLPQIIKSLLEMQSACLKSYSDQRLLMIEILKRTKHVLDMLLPQVVWEAEEKEVIDNVIDKGAKFRSDLVFLLDKFITAAGHVELRPAAVVPKVLDFIFNYPNSIEEYEAKYVITNDFYNRQESAIAANSKNFKKTNSSKGNINSVAPKKRTSSSTSESINRAPKRVKPAAEEKEEKVGKPRLTAKDRAKAFEDLPEKKQLLVLNEENNAWRAEQEPQSVHSFLENARHLAIEEVHGKFALQLPLLIQMSVKHPEYGKVNVVAKLWYVDYYGDYDGKQNGAELFCWQVDDDNKALREIEPVRVCFFHSIEEISPKISPLMLYRGRFFSSLTVTARLFGSHEYGMKAWHLIGHEPKKSLEQFIKAGFKNVDEWENKQIEFPETDPNTQSFHARDLMGMLCIEECNEHSCVLASVRKERVRCRHNLLHEYEAQEINPDGVKWKPHVASEKRKVLTEQWLNTDWGRRIWFRRLKPFVASTTLTETSWWYNSLFDSLRHLSLLHWPYMKLNEYRRWPIIGPDVVQTVADVQALSQWFAFSENTSIFGISRFSRALGLTDDTVFLTTWVLWNSRLNKFVNRFDPKYMNKVYVPISFRLLKEAGLITNPEQSVVTPWFGEKKVKDLQIYQTNEKILTTDFNEWVVKDNPDFKRDYLEFHTALIKNEIELWKANGNAEDALQDGKFAQACMDREMYFAKLNYIVEVEKEKKAANASSSLQTDKAKELEDKLTRLGSATTNWNDLLQRK